jgi:hypothetical protein
MQLLLTPVNSPYSMDLTRGVSPSAEMRGAWESLIRTSNDAGAFEKSPPYFDHLLETRPAGALALVSVRDGLDAIVGVVPLLMGRLALRFDIAGRVLGETGSSGVRILGGLPLLPSGPMMYDLLLEILSRSFPDCGMIGMYGISTEGPLWRYLQHSRSLRDMFDVHVPDGIQLCHTIPLPPSFQGYLGRFKAKKRYNLLRQVRRLREHGGGALELRRIESRHHIPDFVRDMKALDESAWPPGRRRPFYAPVVDGAEFARLADRGLLLCHVLYCGGRPCAGTFGMIYQRRHNLHAFLRDHRLNQFSPGTTLLHLVVEDLIRRGSVDLIDLGFGEPHYTHWSTNILEPRATVFLLRKTLANRTRRWGHSVFKAAAARLKGLQRTIRRRRESDR